MQNFTEKDLVSFGNYLLSKERKEAIVHIKGLSEAERLVQVYDADIANWKTLKNTVEEK